MVFKSKEAKEAERLQKQVAADQAADQERQRLVQAKARREADISAYFDSFATCVAETVKNAGASHLYFEVYVPVDAQMNTFGPAEGLDMSQVNTWGARGWEVVSAVPRTYGGFQSYQVSKTTSYGVSGWGKDTHQVGLGGHVVGVYLLMHRKITAATLEASSEEIRRVAEHNMPDSLRQPVK